MPKSCFTSWTERHPNFLQEPLASRMVDSFIVEVALQHEFKHSKQVRRSFMYFDKEIIKDYTQLIDLKLREGFAVIERDDFANPEGFSDEQKASPAVRNFFEIRKTLEFFVREDICHHLLYPSRLNAFRRWLSIADSLLDFYNYDGFHLVMVILCLIDSQHHLSKSLPTNAKLQFNRLETLIDASGNHTNLRKKIELNTNVPSLKPVFMYSADITRLNQTEDSVKDNDITLKDISKTEFFQKSAILKTNWLETISDRQSIPLQPLPKHLIETYNQMNQQYKDTKTDNQMNQQCRETKTDAELFSSRSPKKVIPVKCTLYRKDLLPSFWSRRGVSPDKFWANTLSLTQSQDNKKAP